MDPSFWQERWREGRIGFHQPRPNDLLLRHLDRAAAGKPARVLVPLCGKSRDMVAIAERGHPVVGVEVAEVAVEAFFRENDMAPARTTVRDMTRYESGSFTILAGDFFGVSLADVGHVNVAYDRAALVALSPPAREAYVAHLLDLLSPNGRVLLVTFGYDQTKMDGPPFSIREADVKALFGRGCDVELLELKKGFGENERFRERGLDELEEAAFLVTKR